MNLKFILWQAVFAAITVTSIWIIVPTKAEYRQVIDSGKPAQQSELIKPESSIHSDSSESKWPAETVNQLISRIDQLHDLVSDLIVTVDNLAKAKRSSFPPLSLPSPPGMQGGGVPFPAPGNMPNPLGWMQKLPDYKKTSVQEAFKENAAMVREKIQALPGGMSNRQQASEIFKQGEQDLKDRLEQILSPEEFEEYLKSMPPMPPPPTMGTMK